MTIRQKVAAVLLGVAGMLVGLAMVHAYVDHQALHAIIGLINQQQEAAKAK